MVTKLKTGTLVYFSRGFLSKKWKEAHFVLYEDSTIQWFERMNDSDSKGSIRIAEVASLLSVGPFTRCIPNRPNLPDRFDENLLISIPKNMQKKEKEILWIICNDLTQLKLILFKTFLIFFFSKFF